MAISRRSIISTDFVVQNIHVIRGHKVMIDSELATLYQVPTKALNQAVQRNIDRFPGDFMFQLNVTEFEKWKSQIVTSNAGAAMGLRKRPYAFTEHGVARDVRAARLSVLTAGVASQSSTSSSSSFAN